MQCTESHCGSIELLCVDGYPCRIECAEDFCSEITVRCGSSTECTIGCEATPTCSVDLSCSRRGAHRSCSLSCSPCGSSTCSLLAESECVSPTPSGISLSTSSNPTASPSISFVQFAEQESAYTTDLNHKPEIDAVEEMHVDMDTGYVVVIVVGTAIVLTVIVVLFCVSRRTAKDESSYLERKRDDSMMSMTPRKDVESGSRPQETVISSFDRIDPGFVVNGDDETAGNGDFVIQTCVSPKGEDIDNGREGEHVDMLSPRGEGVEKKTQNAEFVVAGDDEATVTAHD